MVGLVEVSEEVWLVLLNHALYTEKEEVMGLLLGDIIENTARITALAVLTRSDKRKDRVEVSPEQLHLATQEAEQLSERLGVRTRVIGWYHSHPHITVLPSHVDIQTQALYQMMDSDFVGIIVSCFNQDPANTSGRIQITAFQSAERMDTMEECIDLEGPPVQSGSRLVHVEVPLRVVRWNSAKRPNTLSKLAQLQAILYSEEKTAYQQAISGSIHGQHSLVQVHSAAVYQKALCRLLELETLPALAQLQLKLEQNRQRIAALKEARNRLMEQLRQRRS